MRIMIASSTYAPAMNGQAVFTTSLAEELVRRGHKVLVVLDSSHGGASTKILHGVEVQELRSINLNFIHAGVYFSPFPGSEVKRLFATFRPEIIHIQDHYPICRAVVREARRRRIRIVGSNHFIPANLAPYIPGITRIKPLFNWLLWQWMLDTYRHTDAVIAQSAAAHQIIRGLGLKKPILQISCGIDLLQYYPDPTINRQVVRQRYGIDPQKIVFLFLGRIDGEKHIDLLLHAMQQISRQDVQLVIAGHGKVENSLQQLAVSMQISHKVRFTGFIPAEDVPGLMNSVDVFVMPSEAELLSISTLEAMACGRPVLLANALALPELVKQGENGYLFKAGDVGDLVYGMNLLADQPEAWEAMGLVSRDITIAHSLENTVDKFEMLYSQLVTQGSVAQVKMGERTPA